MGERMMLYTKVCENEQKKSIICGISCGLILQNVVLYMAQRLKRKNRV